MGDVIRFPVERRRPEPEVWYCSNCGFKQTGGCENPCPDCGNHIWLSIEPLDKGAS